MNVYSYSFFDLETAEMHSGLLIANSRERVVEFIRESCFHAFGMTVCAMPELLPAITVNYEGVYCIDTLRLRQLSRELMIRKGGVDL